MKRRYRKYIVVMVTAAALVVGSCGNGNNNSSKQSLSPGDEVTVEGAVTEIDREPMFVDGDGLMGVRSEEHGEVVIRIPARERQCKAAGLDVFSSLTTGNHIRATGEVTEERAVIVCAETHRLEKMEQ